MPLYFFDFRDGEQEPSHDDDGIELPSSDAAKSEALKSLLARGPRFLAERRSSTVSVFVREGDNLLFETALSLQTRDMEEFGEL